MFIYITMLKKNMTKARIYLIPMFIPRHIEGTTSKDFNRPLSIGYMRDKYDFHFMLFSIFSIFNIFI